MNFKIKEKLDTILEFQKDYPKSHIGGSIGLMIRGIDLQRDLTKSDLDITTNEFNPNQEKYEEISDGNDFNFAVKKILSPSDYIKIDIRISNEDFDVIEYEGNTYNVTKLETILKFKEDYASKGYKKHFFDLCVIKYGKRPIGAIIDDSNSDILL